MWYFCRQKINKTGIDNIVSYCSNKLVNISARLDMQNKVTDVILSTISKYLISARNLLPSIDSYSAVLSVLYGIHKEYTVIDVPNQYFFFEEPEDTLLRDLFEWCKNDMYHCYGNSENSVKNYYDLNYSLYRALSDIDHSSFEDAYVTVLTKLFEIMSSSTTSRGEFYSPESINKLISYYINASNCNSVYDPFCGTASIVHSLTKQELKFEGQEINHLVSIWARLNMEARYGYDNGISCADSISQWNESHFEAVVTCPPFGTRFSTEQRIRLESGKDLMTDNLEEVLFSRAFSVNKAKLVAVLEPLSFCYSKRYTNLRKFLVDENYLDTLIVLPEKLLYETSIPSCLVVCKSGRNENDPVRVVDATSYIVDDVKNRSFDFERFIQDIEIDDKSICVYASTEKIIGYDYNLNLYLYNQRLVELKEGQTLVPLSGLVKEVGKKRVSPLTDKHNVLPADFFSRSIIEVILNKNRLILPSEERRSTPRSLVEVVNGKKYVLCIDSIINVAPKFAIYSGDENFTCMQGVKVFEVNENFVTPEYLVHQLINNPVLKTGYGPLSNYMYLQIVVDNIKDQKEIISRLAQQHSVNARLEQEADEKRLGVKQNISDLEHMLGTPQSRVDSLIYNLEHMSPGDDNYHSTVKGLKDNVEYIKRIIQFSNAQISTDMFYLEKIDIAEFIKAYCTAWKNYGGNYFGLSFKNNLDDNRILPFDKTLMKVLLDAILTNAERHGFRKHQKKENLVEMSLDLESYENKPYIVLRVANNGTPFKDGFTLNDYVTRGKYSATSGRSGLGGYHVYQITKGHHGFLYIDSNKIWNVIIEVLLPVDNVEPNNLVEYEHDCI